MEPERLRRSLPARSTRKSFPILTRCTCSASSAGVLWRLMTVNMTMQWERLE